MKNNAKLLLEGGNEGPLTASSWHLTPRSPKDGLADSLRLGSRCRTYPRAATVRGSGQSCSKYSSAALRAYSEPGAQTAEMVNQGSGERSAEVGQTLLLDELSLLRQGRGRCAVLGPRLQAACRQGRKIRCHHGNRQHLGEGLAGGTGISTTLGATEAAQAEAPSGLGEDRSNCREAGSRDGTPRDAEEVLPNGPPD